ncbi:DUF7020 family protein [Shigella flexneri]
MSKDIINNVLSLGTEEKELKKEHKKHTSKLDQSLQRDLSSLETKSKTVKDDYLAYIQDTSIPVEERWKLFEQAPKVMKEHSRYILSRHNPGIQKLLESLDGEHSKDEFKNFDTVELVSDVFEMDCLEDGEEVSEEEKELYKQAIEELLRLNCGSFCYTW